MTAEVFFGVRLRGDAPDGQHFRLLGAALAFVMIGFVGFGASAGGPFLVLAATFGVSILIFVLWRMFRRNLVSVSVSNTTGGVLRLTGTSMTGDQVSVPVDRIVSVGRGNRFQVARLKLIDGAPIGLGMGHNSTAVFLRRLSEELPEGCVRFMPKERSIGGGLNGFFDIPSV